ncbi:MAG TPA: hypothetical protein VK486_13670 [Thermoleophilaceae bacterium]|nr:hypothetical protein [Thermoleophilaceae bacterium]
MTDDQLQQLLTAANPMTAERAAGLSVADAEDDLLAGLMAEPAARPAPGRPRRGRRRVWTRVLPAIAATALVLVAILSLRDSSEDPGSSGTAWAAEQVRFAEASPLVLLGAPGWRVEYADEQSKKEGELQFRRGPAPPPQDLSVSEQGSATPFPADTGSAALNWRGGGIRTWIEDRGADAARSATAPVLGTTAHVYQYQGGTPGHRDITALFQYDGRVLEFRAGAADLDAFKVLLATLKRVDTDTWLSAMPASVVKTADRGVTIRQMLQGVAVPPGFDPKDIKGADLTKDRYQLGAAVAGTVACQWFKRWSDARTANDGLKEREATAAMATAKGWPILNEMAKEGAYPEVLMEYAAAMPSGDWYGRPLTGDVNSGLGCDSLGVDLP